MPDAAIDAIHGVTMVALAALKPARRAAASANALAAFAFAAAGIFEARRNERLVMTGQESVTSLCRPSSLLVSRKRPIESVTSNPGHLLWAGAVTTERAASVTRRLLDNDMWSGWGVRTLSSDHVAYNPVSYQLGSVWPHDNAIIVSGCARYGHGEAAGQIARAQLDAAECFRYGRPPEVFGGFDRDEGSFPVQYLGANVPQAWASGAIIHLVTALCGIEPDAPNRRLALSPQLPDWLDRIELENLRVGTAWVDLVIDRDGISIKEQRGELDVAHEVRSS